MIFVSDGKLFSRGGNIRNLITYIIYIYIYTQGGLYFIISLLMLQKNVKGEKWIIQCNEQTFFYIDRFLSSFCIKKYNGKKIISYLKRYLKEKTCLSLFHFSFWFVSISNFAFRSSTVLLLIFLGIFASTSRWRSISTAIL